MYANDRRGDCTTAAAGHMIEAWTAARRGEAVEISESSVLRAFERVKVRRPVHRARREPSSSTCSASGARTASAGTGSARSRVSASTTTA